MALEEALFIIKNGTVLALSAEGKKKLASDKINSED